MVVYILAGTKCWGAVAMSKRGSRKALMEDRLLDCAATLFSRNGFGATTLQEIADSAGISRTAIYHYYSTKDDVLKKLVEDFATGAEEVVLAASRDESLTHRERLAAATFNLTHRVLQNAIRFRVLERNESSLSGDLAKWHHEAKRRSLTALSELIARGIEGGEFEQVTAQIAALNVFAMCNGTAWWFRPGGSRTAEQIATIVSDMAVRMISRPPELASANSKEAILQRLHADIDVLAGLASKTD